MCACVPCLSFVSQCGIAVRSRRRVEQHCCCRNVAALLISLELDSVAPSSTATITSSDRSTSPPKSLPLPLPPSLLQHSPSPADAVGRCVDAAECAPDRGWLWLRMPPAAFSHTLQSTPITWQAATPAEYSGYCGTLRQTSAGLLLADQYSALLAVQRSAGQGSAVQRSAVQRSAGQGKAGQGRAAQGSQVQAYCGLPARLGQCG